MTQLSQRPVSQAGKRFFAAAFVGLLAAFVYWFANPWQHAATPFQSGDSQVVVPLPAAPAQSGRFQIYQAVDDFPATLRVAKPPRVRLMGLLSPFGAGFEQELLARFAEDYGFAIQNREVAGFSEAYALLKSGQVDLIVGFDGNETVPADENLAASPGYRQNHAVLLSTRKGSAAQKLLVSDPGLVSALPAGGKRAAADKNKTQQRAVEPNVHDIFAGLDKGAAGAALMDATSSALMRPFFLGVTTRARDVSPKTESRWYWRKDGALPDLALTSFWQDKDTKTLLTDLEERYFGFLPVGVNAPALESLMGTLGDELQRYHEAIAKASRQYSLDPLLLTAVIFQESGFDTNAVSPTGAKGLLQFTNSTAQLMGVNRADPVSSIYGGARYLRKLWDSLGGYELSFWDRWFLALAAYNQGPAHLQDAVALARRVKGDGSSWGSVKSVLPLMGRGEYAGQSKYGACRGSEAVRFVENVRYYYYVLNGLVVLDRPEAEHLAPLLAINAGSGRAARGWSGL